MLVSISRVERRAAAKVEFIRLMVATVVAGVLMVVGALYYLSRGEAMSTAMIAAVILGVFFSIVIGAGLMAAGFYSSRSGHDEDATGPPGKL